MNKLTLGLIGYGNVGSGVVKFLHKKRSYIRSKFQIEFDLKIVCDKLIHEKTTQGLENVTLTTDFHDVLNDPQIDAVIELIGGNQPAHDIISGALKKGKHVISANKELIARHGRTLFQEAHVNNRNIYFESSVMAGVPVIKSITEGLAGNQINVLYGIINGTCNYILTEMRKNNYSFAEAVAAAQKSGFAESDPTLDINGMDSAHKLAILISLTMGKFIALSDIHTEGITDISHLDIENAEHLGLTIKLLAIAKKVNDQIEARVHPTLISQDHPLAAINGVYNALLIQADPLGHILISGEGAGQMSAASGVVSDLINLASRKGCESTNLLGNLTGEALSVQLRPIEEILTKFYIRFMATDKPGVLSKIAGILGERGIGINSVTQKAHSRVTAIPVIMLTDYAPEKMVREALAEIHQMPLVRGKPVAIRMEDL